MSQRFISIHSTARVETFSGFVNDLEDIQISIHSTARVETIKGASQELFVGISIHSTARVETGRDTVLRSQA